MTGSAVQEEPALSSRMPVRMSVNGRRIAAEVEPRRLLVDFIRDDLGLVATHLGCGEGACGACTVLIDGVLARSCTLLAVQAEQAAITTVEGLNRREGLTRVQAAFQDHHALQCGYCTPGLLVTVAWMEAERLSPDDAVIETYLAGHLCRCTGYRNIVAAVRAILTPSSDSEDRSGRRPMGGEECGE